MSIATFKDLCIDVNDLESETAFWANTLGLEVYRYDDGDLKILGPNRGTTVWPCVVPEPKTVKNRVHLDVWAPSLDPFGSLERVSEPGEFRWETFKAPSGQEFCVFVRPDGPAAFKSLEVDSADHVRISSWWTEVLGGDLTNDEEGGYSYLENVPGCPGEGFDFCPVPEPKSVKNRVHWDIDLRPGHTVEDLVECGARVLREPDGVDIRWTVMADPEGNEFCVFTPDESS